jgi:peptidoglycan hydrolase-like protein with peptidoglycan-binding domain
MTTTTSGNKKAIAIGGAAALLALMLTGGRRRGGTNGSGTIPPLVPGGGEFGGGGATEPLPPIVGPVYPGGPIPFPPGTTTPPAGGNIGGVPASVLARMASVLATGDPKLIRAEAAKLKAEGYKPQAEDLERAALLLEQSGQTPPPSGTTPPPVVLPPATTPPSSSTPPQTLPPAMRVLKAGMSGADVQGWQLTLQKDGFLLEADGKFGPVTTQATKDWQSDRGIASDGIVGPETLSVVGRPPQLGGRLLRLNSEGGAVVLWKGLMLVSNTGAPVGLFDEVTDAKTRAHQRLYGLQPDGIVGPKTLATVGQTPPPATGSVTPLRTVDPDTWRTMRRGTSGPDVGEWQMVLNRDGYSVAVDNVFGPETEAATRAWQTANKLEPDGVVGPASRAKIQDKPSTSFRVAGDDVMLESLPFRAVSPLPGIIAASIPTEVVPRDRALAARTAEHLFNTPRGNEDRALVAEFQALVGVGQSGAYNRETAEALVPFGIVPPKPFYWPQKGSIRAKVRYRAALLEQAQRDPQRADEWRAAAQV